MGRGGLGRVVEGEANGPAGRRCPLPNPASPTSGIIATGVLTAGGKIKANNGKNGTAQVTLPSGTFKITHHTKHLKASVNPQTCLFSVTWVNDIAEVGLQHPRGLPSTAARCRQIGQAAALHAGFSSHNARPRLRM